MTEQDPSQGDARPDNQALLRGLNGPPEPSAQQAPAAALPWDSQPSSPVQVGDVVNGHRFNGLEWVPIAMVAPVAPPPPATPSSMVRATPPPPSPAGYLPGTPGAGAYEGLTWDGKGWVGHTTQPGRRNGKGTASLVLGIISIVLCGGGLLLPILAVVFGRQGMNNADIGLADNRGVAKAGFILGIIALAMGAVWALLYGIAFVSDPSAFQ